MRAIFRQCRSARAFFPNVKTDFKTYISIGTFGGNIIHLIGGEQNPARFKITEVSVW